MCCATHSAFCGRPSSTGHMGYLGCFFGHATLSRLLESSVKDVLVVCVIAYPSQNRRSLSTVWEAIIRLRVNFIRILQQYLCVASLKVAMSILIRSGVEQNRSPNH